MLLGVGGKRGVGKSAFAVQLVRKLNKYANRIASNILLRFGCGVEYYRAINHVEHFENGVFFTDELQSYVDSRDYAVLPAFIKDKIAMCRKDNMDWIFTVQSIKDIDVKFRRQLDVLYYLSSKFVIWRDFPFFGQYSNMRKPFFLWSKVYEIDVENSQIGLVDQGLPDNILVLRTSNFFIWPWSKKYYNSEEKISSPVNIKVWDYSQKGRAQVYLSAKNPILSNLTATQMMNLYQKDNYFSSLS